MATRQIDKNNDWVLNGLTAYITGNDEVLQNIKTRLQQWKYNCYFALNEGVNYNNYLGNKGFQEELKQNIADVVINTYGVQNLISLDFVYNSINRKINVNIIVNTIFEKQQQVEYII